MTTQELVSVIGAAAWLPGVWGIVQAVRKRRRADGRAADESDRIVVKSAIELLAPYKVRVEELENKLGVAEHTITDLNAQLSSANRKVADLTTQLGDAQTELAYLRLQVKTLTQQLPDH